MEHLTERTLAAVDKNDTTGPSFRIDPADKAVCERLKKLRDELLKADPPLRNAAYAAPERWAAQVGAQADIVVEALLASGGKPVYTYALTRAQDAVDNEVLVRFGEACAHIAGVEGVVSK